LSRLEPKRAVMVIGYNVRPIACLAKQLGFRVVAVDYWGDLDISNCADDLHTVLQQRPGEQLKESLDNPPCELLVDLAEKNIKEFVKVNFILVGSGFDDRPDLWTRLSRIAPILGNSPEQLKAIRNLSKLFTIARELGINCPKTEKAKSPKEAVEIAKRIGFPVVLKPISGSGGFRIRFANDLDEVKNHFAGVAGEREEAWVQEHVKGVDASSSIIGNGHECVVVSVNEQLIGKNKLGASTPFGYCGSIVPLAADSEVIERIKMVSSALGKKLGLVGSNGFDFVIGPNNEPYLMEVNPRFQATLECIRFVTGLNLVGEHINACGGQLLRNVLEPNGYAVKMIIFAKEKCVYPDLNGIKSIFDISHKDVIVEKGNPICTVQVVAEEREKAISKSMEIVSEIHRRLKPP
jgi:predicted ATP-grasp superfamily ATP-dependent carboligase